MYHPVIERTFEDVSDSYDAAPGNILLTTLRVAGSSLHLQAIRVTDDAREQRAYDDNVQSELDLVYAIYPDCAFQTTDLPGFAGRFILYAHPFGE